MGKDGTGLYKIDAVHSISIYINKLSWKAPKSTTYGESWYINSGKEREETRQCGTWCLLEHSEHNNRSSEKTTSFTPKYAYSDHN